MMERGLETSSQVATEETLEAIKVFNEEMGTLASNACLLEELMQSAVQEASLIREWITKMEVSTLKEEEKKLKILETQDDILY